jgi:hypothetical protein
LKQIENKIMFTNHFVFLDYKAFCTMNALFTVSKKQGYEILNTSRIPYVFISINYCGYIVCNFLI